MNARHAIRMCLFAALLAATSSFALAQIAPPIQWDKSVWNGRASANGIQQTSDGGYIVAGWSSASGGGGPVNHGGHDVWVAKLDNLGNTTWQKLFGGTGDDEARSIQQTTDGGYVVAGFSTSSNGDATSNQGYADFWILKLDAVGALTWQVSLGGTSDDEANSIQQTTDGGYIVAGYTFSNNGDVTGAHDNRGNTGTPDYWVVKLSATGALQWQKTLGGTNRDQANCVRQATDGGYIVAGWSYVDPSTTGDPIGNHGTFDYWVVKLDNAGSMQWQKSLGGLDEDEATCLQLTSDGGYVVAGYSQSSNADVTGNHGSLDYWVVKLDNAGNLQWQKSLGGSSGDYALAIQQTTDGGYAVFGYSGSTNGDVTGNRGAIDYWLVQLDQNGKLLWQRTLGGSNSDYASDMKLTADGGFIVCGSVLSTDGDISSHLSGDWIVKLGPAPAVPIITSVSSKAMPSMLCDTIAIDSVWVRNVGTKTLTISGSAFLGATANELRVVVPAAFPVTIAQGDSLRFVIKRTALLTGNKLDTLALTNDDPVPGRSPWYIQLTERKDRASVSVSGVLQVDSLQAGTTVDAITVFQTTGTVPDTITSVQRISGVSWISFQQPALPRAVLTAPPRDTARLRFRINAPRDTGWFAAQFRVHSEPCGIDTVITVRVYLVSGILLTVDKIIQNGILCETEQCDSFTVRNVGNGPLVVSGAQCVGNDAAQFSGPVPAAPLTIPPHAALTMRICFRPRIGITGARSTSIWVVTNDSMSPVFSKVIAVTAQKDSADIGLSDSVLNAGDVCVGMEQCVNDSMWAAGTVGQTVRSVRFVSGSTAYRIALPAGSVFLPVGTAGSIRACFLPVDTGTFVARFSVETDPCNRSKQLTITGRGVRADLVTQDTVVDFGSVPVTQTRSGIVRLVVRGNGSVRIDGVALSPSGSHIAIDSTRPPLPVMLQPNDTLAVFVHFSPITDEQDVVKIALTLGTACATTPVVRVSGNGVSGALFLSRSSIDCGPLDCGETEKSDTVTLTNAGAEPLTITESLAGPDAAMFRIMPPANYTLAANAVQEIVVRFAPTTVGSRSATLMIESEDPLQRQSHIQVPLSGREDTIGETVSGTVNDTLDFGSAPVGIAKDRAITLTNASSTATAFTLSSANSPLFAPLVTSVSFAGAGGQQPIVVHFSGAAIVGKYFGVLRIVDMCGRVDSVFLVATVDSSTFDVSPIPDTTICPNDSVIRTITIRNLTTISQTYGFTTTSTSYVLPPDSVTIAAGDSAVITVVFPGASTEGSYPLILRIADARGIGHAISSIVHVQQPHVVVPATLMATGCPFEAIPIPIVVGNLDSISRSVVLSANGCTIDKQGAVIPPGRSDSVIATFPGADTGTYSCMVHVVDECGVSHDVAITFIVRTFPPLALSLQSDSAAMLIGAERSVYIVATPRSSVAPGVAFSVANEPTALSLDSVTSPGVVATMMSGNSVRISILGGSWSASDTIATLHYRTLVGSTLQPRVTLENVSTAQHCAVAGGSGDVTLTLAPPGCELGTVAVHPFTTELHSIAPNPATGAVVITYSTVEEANVCIEVHDALGRVVRSIVDGVHKPGVYTAVFETGGLVNGMYVVTMREGAVARGMNIFVTR